MTPTICHCPRCTMRRASMRPQRVRTREEIEADRQRRAAEREARLRVAVLTPPPAEEIIHSFSGYAIIWGAWSVHRAEEKKNKRGLHKRRVMRGALDDWMQLDREVCVIQDQNEDSPVFAKRSDGSLQLECDDIGMIATVHLRDTAANRLLAYRVRTGALRGWCCRTSEGTQTREELDMPSFTASRVSLLNVAVVIRSIPHIPNTAAAPKLLTGGPEIEETLHVHG